jgi:hypothetical protein
MPNIKVIYWNIENFGSHSLLRGDYVPVCNFIAEVVRNVDADILCVMEVRSPGTRQLRRLQRALLNAYHNGVIQTCDWYLDYVAGALYYNRLRGVYDPNRVGFTDQGRHEGYAVFWKQNIDKFLMRQADPINLANANPPGFPAAGAGTVPNTHSQGVQARDVAAPFSSHLPAAGLVIPGGAGQYTLPTGSTVGAGGIIRAGGVHVVAGVTAAPTLLNGGDIISGGTQIAADGVRLTNLVLGVNPIVIPGNYTLTTNLTLPLAGALVVAQHVLSLVLSCRPVAGGAPANNYNPGGVNHWELGRFPGASGALLWNGSRRPAYCTIQTNTAGPAAQQLIPITFYHAPLKVPDQGMKRCAIAQPLYEAWRLGAVPAYVHNARAIVGGDFNARLDPAAAHYTIYTNNYAANGADCNDAGNQNIRVNSAAPLVAPAFPPVVGALSEADNPLNKSSVQLRHPVIGGNPVLSASIDHYRRLAIDNIFYRGFTAAQAPRFVFRATLAAGGAQQRFDADLYDLVRAVSQTLPPGAVAAAGAVPDNFFIPPAILNAFANVEAFLRLVAGQDTETAFNSVEYPWELLTDLFAGVFQTHVGGDPPSGLGPYAGPAPLPVVITPERRAAEFIKLFVSDHLPVIFEMAI